MVQHWLLKILVFPITVIYAIGISIHNWMYSIGFLRGVRFNIPVISVGNLSIGGAGKTPHVEYLIRLLKDHIDIGTLSRGYKRKTKGYLSVRTDHNAIAVGDEPLQYKRKYPDIQVSVCENRMFAIPEMLKSNPGLQAVLLDDAFQHRTITPGANLLLTEYNYPYSKDFLLPTGRLREWRSAADRADVVIATKCGLELTNPEAEKFKLNLGLRDNQKLFFTYYEYGLPYHIHDPDQKLHLHDNLDVIIISAIARVEYLVDHVATKVKFVKTLEFEDHHYFTNQDISILQRTYENLDSSSKAIITTEKDATRLELHKSHLDLNDITIYAMPVKVKFHFGGALLFDRYIKEYLLNFKI